jgi:DNA-binding LacI/PurR family transcriptional regulator
LVKPAPDSVILEIDMQACQQREGVEPVLCILPSSREEARTVLRNTLATSAPPWGICCYNDEVAFAVLAALADENIAIPLTAAVVGCDNIPLAQWSLPALTTIAFHNEPELDALIEAIVALSHGEAVSWRTHKTLTLVKRASA